MIPNYNVMLVDALPVLYRACHALGHLSYEGVFTGGIYGFLRDIKGMKKKFGVDWVYVVWDEVYTRDGTGERSIKAEGFEEYKANRKKTELTEKVYGSVDSVKEIIRASDWENASRVGWEADDLIGEMAKQKAASGMTVIIISPDADIYQCVCRKVNVYWKHQKKEKLVDLNWCKEMNEGAHPMAWLMKKIVNGDVSDNIKPLGISRKLRKRVNEIIGEYDRDIIPLNYGMVSEKLGVLEKSEWAGFREQVEKRRVLFSLGVVENPGKMYNIQKDFLEMKFSSEEKVSSLLKKYGIKSMKGSDFMYV